MYVNIWSLCWRVLVSQTSSERKIEVVLCLCFQQNNISLLATSEGQIVPTAFGLV